MSVITSHVGVLPLVASRGGTGLATLTAHAVQVGNGTGTMTQVAVGSSGQLLVGSTGADPVFATLGTGSGITATTGAGTLSVAVSTDGYTIVDQASGSATLAVQTKYITDNGASLVTYTLPAAAAQGTSIIINGKSAGGWKIAQGAGQTIHYTSDTTTGTGGSLSSTSKYNCVKLTCITANTDFVVESATGTLTIV